jgi:hypothetical protein
MGNQICIVNPLVPDGPNEQWDEDPSIQLQFDE